MSGMKPEEAIEILSLARFTGSSASELDAISEALDVAFEALKEARPRGKWDFIGNNLFMCTVCSYIADADWLHKWKQHTNDIDFPTACPKCGADMREGEEE